MRPPLAGRPLELPVLRLHGQCRGFVVCRDVLCGDVLCSENLCGETEVAPEPQPTSARLPPWSPEDRPGGSTLLELKRPLTLGKDPLLLLLDNADSLPETLLISLEALLSTGERQALRQRRHPPDRSRHVAGLALVRLILGELLGNVASALPIERGWRGKPQLAPGPWPPLQFNLSHSGSLLLLGLHRQRPIGVDLERHRPGLRWKAIARRCFSAETLAALEATPQTEQLQSFTEAWCRLEATLKADGGGLATRAGARSGGFDQGTPPQLFRPRLPAGYSGAVVLAGSPPSAEAAGGRACTSTASGGIHIASP